jgi:hypothetical protein
MYAALLSAGEITPDGRRVPMADECRNDSNAGTTKDDRQDELFPPCPITPGVEVEVEVPCSARDRIDAMAS